MYNGLVLLTNDTIGRLVNLSANVYILCCMEAMSSVTPRLVTFYV